MSIAITDRPQPIPIWSSKAPGPDPTAHYWYRDHLAQYCRLCDDALWPDVTTLPNLTAQIHVPCRLCDELFVADQSGGRRVLDPTQALERTSPSVLYSPPNGGYTHGAVGYTVKTAGYTPKYVGREMDIKPVPMAAFARFYEATPAQKVNMVRDARTYQLDPDGWAGRDFYGELRTTLRQTHWLTNDIRTFEDAVEPLLQRQRQVGKREHYRAIGKAYINYWKKWDAQLFKADEAVIHLANLPIRVHVELGMQRRGDDLALKLWFNAPHPTRGFRQAIRYLTEQGRQQAEWHQDWKPAIWDVRREEILPDVSVPKDLGRALQGQAGAFVEIWKSLES